MVASYARGTLISECRKKIFEIRLRRFVRKPCSLTTNTQLYSESPDTGTEHTSSLARSFQWNPVCCDWWQERTLCRRNEHIRSHSGTEQPSAANTCTAGAGDSRVHKMRGSWQWSAWSFRRRASECSWVGLKGEALHETATPSGGGSLLNASKTPNTFSRMRLLEHDTTYNLMMPHSVVWVILSYGIMSSFNTPHPSLIALLLPLPSSQLPPWSTFL